MTSDNEQDTKEQLNRDELFELYKIAIEEARHRDQLVFQSFTLFAITITLVGTLAYHFGFSDSMGFKPVIASLGSLFGFFASLILCQVSEARDVCRDIASKIEGILQRKGKRTILTSELFVMAKIKSIERSGVKPLFIKRQIIYLFSLFMFLGVWWYFWLVIL